MNPIEFDLNYCLSSLYLHCHFRSYCIKIQNTQSDVKRIADDYR